MAQEDIERFHLLYSSRTLEKSWELDIFQLSAFTKFLCDSIDIFLHHSQDDRKTTLADLDIIRQYCRIIAKFIDRPLAEQYIDKIIEIVQSDRDQNHENNETYFNYYGGKDAACQAFIKHLQVAKPKYDAKLHIYLLGDIAGTNYLPQFEAAVNNWSSKDYEQKRVFIEEAIKMITARAEINAALPH